MLIWFQKAWNTATQQKRIRTCKHKMSFLRNFIEFSALHFIVVLIEIRLMMLCQVALGRPFQVAHTKFVSKEDLDQAGKI